MQSFKICDGAKKFQKRSHGVFPDMPRKPRKSQGILLCRTIDNPK